MRKRTRKTVLIVSSDVPGRSGLTEMLEGAGYQVAVAPDRAEALESIQKQAVDVVVADTASECKDLDLLEELRQGRKKLPVVIVSARSEVELYLEAMNRGAFDFLVHPLSAKEFLSVVRKALSWSPRRRRAA